MIRSIGFAKAAALSSSILLASGYVVYRGGVFGHRAEAPDTILSGSKSASAISSLRTVVPKAPAKEELEKVIIGASKSTLGPGVAGEVPGETMKAKPLVIMGGSKSRLIVDESGIIRTRPPAPSEEPPVKENFRGGMIMGGSKSMRIDITPPPVPVEDPRKPKRPPRKPPQTIISGPKSGPIEIDPPEAPEEKPPAPQK